MGTLWGYLFLLMAFVVKASEDFSDMLQKEITGIDLLDPDADKAGCLQRPKEVSAEVLSKLFNANTGHSGHSVLRPRSMEPSIPSIAFPPAHPTHSNLQAICRHSNHRPRYPKATLPRNGYGYLYRQADAINHLESWFAECCSSGTEDEQLTLCCLQQAWKESLSEFCNAEFMVKTSHYHCCKKEEPEKWECFEKHAPDQSYKASDHKSWTNIPAPSFKFNSSTCQKTSTDLTVRSIRDQGAPDISFPPGRPNSANIGSICANHKQRFRYLSKSMSSSDNDWLARQSKAIKGLEKGLRQCCKQKEDELACAEIKWTTMVDKFCKDEKKAKANQFECCKKERGEKQYECFAGAAPNPDYILDDDSRSPPQARPSLDMLCIPENIMLQREALHSVDVMVAHCCPREEEKWLACFQTEMLTQLNKLCQDDPPNEPCCMKKANSRKKCFTKQLLRNIYQTKFIRNKKYPISS